MAADRAPDYATGMHGVGQNTTIDLTSLLPDMMSWATGGANGGGQISFELIPNDAQVVDTIQSQENMCGMATTATLSITYCP